MRSPVLIYEASGCDSEKFQTIKKQKGYLEDYRQWRPSLAYAARQVVNDYSDSVIDFGAGHSHFEDPSLFNRVEKTGSDSDRTILYYSKTKEGDDPAWL